MLKRPYLYIQQYPLAKQLIRFGFVGCTSAMVSFLIVVALVSTLHINPLIANIIAFIIAFQVSFHGHKTWTFEHEERALPAMRKFFAVALIGFGLNECLYAFFLHVLHWQYQIALIFVLGLVAIFTFFLSKLWAFK